MASGFLVFLVPSLPLVPRGQLIRPGPSLQTPSPPFKFRHSSASKQAAQCASKLPCKIHFMEGFRFIACLIPHLGHVIRKYQSPSLLVLIGSNRSQEVSEECLDLFSKPACRKHQT